jgi:ribosomal protein S18 acetylase RimI-like enzyme
MTTVEKIDYQIEKSLDLEAFRELLIASTLGVRRPVDDPQRLASMVQHANLIVTARQEGKLVGVARSLSDFAFATYLSDLAVHRDYQKQGIGKELIRQTKLAVPQSKIILLAAPAAVNYYPHIGMTPFEHCFLLDDVNALK